MAGLFGGAPQPPRETILAAPPPAPEPPKPIVMPNEDPEALKQAEAKKQAKARARSTTRAATILGGDEDTLG